MDVIIKDNEVSVPEKPLLRFHQREELKQEVDSIDEALHPQNPYSHLRKNSVDVAEAISRGKRLKKQLETYSPPQLDGRVKDKLAKRAKELEDKIVQGMPTHEEMRKNPAGMVGRHMKHEKANKKAILEWKNIQQMLEPDSNDPDLSNFERLRPSGEMDRFRGDAQINGHMSYGNIPQWMWDRVFQGAGPVSALDQVKKVEAEQAPVLAEGKVDGRKRQRTEAEKIEFAKRMAAGRAAKAQAQSEPQTPTEGEEVPFEGA